MSNPSIHFVQILCFRISLRQAVSIVGAEIDLCRTEVYKLLWKVLCKRDKETGKEKMQISNSTWMTILFTHPRREAVGSSSS